MNNDIVSNNSELVAVGLIRKINLNDYSVNIVQKVRDLNFLYRYDKRNNVFLKNGHVNSFVYTVVGSRVVIMKIMEQEVLGQSVSLKAVIVGYIEGNQFHNGFAFLPIIESECFSLTHEMLSVMFELNDANKITIGQDLENDLIDVKVDKNLYFLSHLGVFGVTGSGKSNTLAKHLNLFIDELIENEVKTHSVMGNIVLFDLNNEYKDRIYNNSNKIKHIDFNDGYKMPYIFGLIINDILINSLVLDSEVNRGFVQDIIKEFYKYKENGAGVIGKLIDDCSVANELGLLQLFLFVNNEFTIIDKVTNMGEEELINFCNLDYKNLANFKGSSLPQLIEPLRGGLGKLKDTNDEIVFLLIMILYVVKAKNGKNLNYVEPLVQRTASLIKVLIENFENFNDKIYEKNTIDKDTDDKGTKNLFSSIFEDKILLNICVDSKSDAERDIIISIISSMLLKIQREKRNKPDKIENVINIVIDEAHNVLGNFNNEDDDKIFSTEFIFNRIIKEGRKEGVFLTVVTQMPSKISNTILSQLQNYYVHRLINEKDIKAIPNSLILSSQVGLLSKLNVGEALVFGKALPTSRIIKITKLGENEAPNSNDIKLFK
jgi:hypothetical protein